MVEYDIEYTRVTAGDDPVRIPWGITKTVICKEPVLREPVQRLAFISRRGTSPIEVICEHK